jgi:hypothetical protein
MLINVDHLTHYDYISNSTVVMQVDISTYQLADGDPGAGAATGTFTNTPAK